MKSLSRSLSVSLLATLGFVSCSAFAVDASVESDFKQCAAAPLSDKNMTAQTIKFEDASGRYGPLDHNAAKEVREYRMSLVTKSGDSLGKFACTIDENGALSASKMS